jgi:hypothetical protein
VTLAASDPAVAAASADDAATGRRRHYSEFYAKPDGIVGADERVLIAIGNCQAESLRLALPGDDATSDGGLRTVRLPPVHELTADDLPHLAGWLARADVIVLQPIRDGYRGLPLGTAQLLALARPGARSAVVPVIRFAGLYPRQLIVRPPSDPSLSPPLVAYHDAAVLAEAAGARLPALTPAAVRAVAGESVQALRLREERHGAIPISDVFASPSFAQMRTINHPGNPIWVTLAERMLEHVGVPLRAADPGIPLLDAVHAPRESAVIEAFGLDDEARPHWIVDGGALDPETVREAHLAWYAEHPDVVPAGLERHAATLRLLGMTA